VAAAEEAPTAPEVITAKKEPTEGGAAPAKEAPAKEKEAKK